MVLPSISLSAAAQAEEVTYRDAGTDSGATFTSPDADTMPRGQVGRIATRHFAVNEHPVPLGTVIFKRL